MLTDTVFLERAIELGAPRSRCSGPCKLEAAGVSVSLFDLGTFLLERVARTRWRIVNVGWD